MSKIPSRKTKLHNKMGSGVGKNYAPYITTSEFNSQGTTSVINDWKTGRQVHCLSQAEAYWYFVLRWNDENVDIREQFPLDRTKTEKIALDFGFKHPGTSPDYVMTTDFLVTKANKQNIAYSVKVNQDKLSDRALQILCIEKQYWLNEGYDFQMLFKTDINLTLVHNIRSVVPYYDKTAVFDKYSEIKHLIAIKEIPWDMENVKITNNSLDEWRSR